MARIDSDTYELVYIRDTEKAIAVKRTTEEDDDDDLIWLPKSQIDYDEDCAKGEIIEVEIPDWLAIEKDL